MKLSLAIAEKLLLLCQGEKLAASKLKHPIVNELIGEGIIYKPGKNRSLLQLVNPSQLVLYLQNYYQITDLANYVSVLKQTQLSRAELVEVSSDSKLQNIRTFTGFLVNCYQPIKAKLNQQDVVINPIVGSFSFIYDFETFIPAADVTIVGIENPENFRYIAKQQYLFPNLKPLFVSRYPQQQSKDLIKWLQQISNQYLHFGDFDLAGINIYLNEFHRYLGTRANFLIPNNLPTLIKQYGNPDRYDKQINIVPRVDVNQPQLAELIKIIHQAKKGLDQEFFINFG